jgi:hypothetical protein
MNAECGWRWGADTEFTSKLPGETKQPLQTDVLIKQDAKKHAAMHGDMCIHCAVKFSNTEKHANVLHCKMASSRQPCTPLHRIASANFKDLRTLVVLSVPLRACLAHS